MKIHARNEILTHNIVALSTVGKSFYFAIFASFAFLAARLRPYTNEINNDILYTNNQRPFNFN